MNTEPEIAIWALTPGGLNIARKLSAHFKGSSLFISEKINDSSEMTPFQTLADAVSEHFRKFQGHIFIMATGIVVRVIANQIQHKTKDPAVVVVDDAGKYAISLIAGHLGGANELAQKAAEQTGGIPVSRPRTRGLQG